MCCDGLLNIFLPRKVPCTSWGRDEFAYNCFRVLLLLILLWFDQHLWWEMCALIAVCVSPLPWNDWFCCTWGKENKKSPPPYNKKWWLDVCSGNLGVSPLKHFLETSFSFFPPSYLLVNFTLSLQVLPVDELVGDPLYSSPGIIVLLLVHLPKTTLRKCAGGVRHPDPVVMTGK